MSGKRSVFGMQIKEQQSLRKEPIKNNYKTTNNTAFDKNSAKIVEETEKS